MSGMNEIEMIFWSICLEGEKELFSTHESFFFHKVLEAKNILTLEFWRIYQHVLAHDFQSYYIVFCD